jgi:hypothetical protein
MSFFKKQRTRSVWGLVQWEWGGYKERVKKGEYGENNIYSCIKMEK